MVCGSGKWGQAFIGKVARLEGVKVVGHTDAWRN
jgi:hypothetical protein